jgi:hypothetical protein
MSFRYAEHKKVLEPECFRYIDEDLTECVECFINPLCGMASCFRRSKEISDKYK